VCCAAKKQRCGAVLNSPPPRRHRGRTSADAEDGGRRTCGKHARIEIKICSLSFGTIDGFGLEASSSPPPPTPSPSPSPPSSAPAWGSVTMSELEARLGGHPDRLVGSESYRGRTGLKPRYVTVWASEGKRRRHCAPSTPPQLSTARVSTAPCQTARTGLKGVAAGSGGGGRKRVGFEGVAI